MDEILNGVYRHFQPPEGARTFKKFLKNINRKENKGEKRMVSSLTIELHAIP